MFQSWQSFHYNYSNLTALDLWKYEDLCPIWHFVYCSSLPTLYIHVTNKQAICNWCITDILLSHTHTHTPHTYTHTYTHTDHIYTGTSDGWVYHIHKGAVEKLVTFGTEPCGESVPHDVYSSTEIQLYNISAAASVILIGSQYLYTF